MLVHQTLSCFTLSLLTSLLYATLKQFPISDPIRNKGVMEFQLSLLNRAKQQGAFYEKNTINNAGMSFQVSKQHPSMIYSNLYRVKIIQLPVVSPVCSGC